jgi:ribosomal protein S18 acetylase RimI-like enzyme
VRIEHVAPAQLDRLRDLWLELHRHHQAVAPELAPFVTDEASWIVRRAFYADVLRQGGVALVVRSGERDLGYALAGPEPAPWPATFVTAPEVQELQTLVLVPEARGRGIGSMLLDEIEATRPAGDRAIGVIPGNVRAVGLYERRGFVPTWLTLTRFGRPPEPGPVRASEPVAAVAADEVGSLEPLWLELHHHHQAVAPRLGPFVGDGPSWELVRALFTAAAGDGLLLRTGPAGAPTGLACVAVSRDDPLWNDTWITGREVAETKMLVVADGARRRGIGSALLDEVDRRLADAAVRDQVIGAIAPNAGAIQLYRRRGFRPAWLQLTRFAARATGR